MKIYIFLAVGIITFLLGGAIIEPDDSIAWGILLFTAIFAGAMSTLFLYLEGIVKQLKSLPKQN